jgi:flavin-dependent dehydrogenase
MAFSNEYLMSNAEESPTEIYFTSYLAPGGRAWVYPLGGKSALAGIYGVRIHPDTALDEFLGRVAPPSLAKAVPIASSRGQIPLQGPLEQTCGNGVIAVGGAAGQICPFSGTGLRYALACGELAGKTAVDAITEGDVSKVGLSGYDSAWKSDFEAEFKACGILHSALAVAQDPKLDEILRVLKESPPLRRAFLNLLVGTRSRSSLKTLLRNDEIADILGHGVRDKILKFV